MDRTDTRQTEQYLRKLKPDKEMNYIVEELLNTILVLNAKFAEKEL